MTPPAKAIKPLTKTVSRKREPKRKFFDDYVWHYKVHEHIEERLSYFLLVFRPYNATKLDSSLRRLVKEKDIHGLRAYRVFGQRDLFLRAWMDSKTYSEMSSWIPQCIKEGSGSSVKEWSDPYKSVEYRWYKDVTRPSQERLLNKLSDGLVRQIESGEDMDSFHKYLSEGLIIPKPSKADSITFFICLKFPDNSLTDDVREQLVGEIRGYFSRCRNDFFYPEIDLVLGRICDLMIRARARTYFPIGRFTKWLSENSNVGSTETYLSLTECPVFGDTELSPRSWDARDAPDQTVRRLVPNLVQELYPRRKWGPIADEVIHYLISKKSLDPSHGLQTFMTKFLLCVLQDSKDGKKRIDTTPAVAPLIPNLETHLGDQRSVYVEEIERIKKKGLTFAKVKELTSPKSPEERGLVNYLKFYYKVFELAGRTVKGSGDWPKFADVRNKPFHGSPVDWQLALNTVIEHWPIVHALLKEIHGVWGKNSDKGPPEFWDE